MAFNPNAVFISPSSLSAVEKCPQLYYYSNVYRSPRGLKIQIVNPSLSLGSLVHDVLSQFLSLDPSARDEKELKRISDSLWNLRSGKKGGFSSRDEEREFHSRGDSMLARFWANEHFRSAVGAKIPSFPKVELGQDIILTGKLDWVETDGNGSYSIIDFKTGKNKEREDSYQLPIYSVLISHLFKTTEVKAKYWYLDKDEPMQEVGLPPIADSLTMLKQKGEVIKMVKQTTSYHCQSGGESCWACKDILAVAQGKGELVGIDMNRKQEIYILPGEPEKNKYSDDLPF